jgi:uncharacterized protein YpmS
MEKIKQENSDPVEGKKLRGRKIILWCISILFALFCALIGVVLWFASSVFDHTPRKIVRTSPDYDSMEQIAAKFGIGNGGDPNKDSASKLMEFLLQDVKIVELSKEEVKTLCSTSVTSSELYLNNRMPELTITDCRFENGYFTVECSFENSFNTPFGKYINIRIIFSPKILKKHIYLKIKSFSVGSITVKGEQVQDLVDQELAKFEQTQNGKDLLTVIKTFFVEKERVTIVLYPKKAALLLGIKLTE